MRWIAPLWLFVTLAGAVPLSQRRLAPPVEGMKLADLRDTFHESRSGAREHEATDILAPRGTPVIAVEDGTIVKLFHSKAGGITIYQFDPVERYCYYYAHLDHYQIDLKEGEQVHKGQVIGFVGTTGNAPPNAPHLHFAISQLGPGKKWWKGTPIDPYPYLRAAALRLLPRG